MKLVNKAADTKRNPRTLYSCTQWHENPVAISYSASKILTSRQVSCVRLFLALNVHPSGLSQWNKSREVFSKLPTAKSNTEKLESRIGPEN